MVMVHQQGSLHELGCHGDLCSFSKACVRREWVSLGHELCNEMTLTSLLLAPPACPAQITSELLEAATREAHATLSLHCASALRGMLIAPPFRAHDPYANQTGETDQEAIDKCAVRSASKPRFVYAVSSQHETCY